MIFKTGVDIIEIKRIKESVCKYKEHFLERVFTAKEIAYSKDKHYKFSHLAARFCAKEAVMKALGMSLDFKNIEIINDKAGAPQVKLYGRANKAAKGKKMKNIQVSLSHCKEYAVAVAIVEIK